jgi:hypothetical protein
MELVMLAAAATWDNHVGAGQVARGHGEGSLSRWFTKRSSSLHQKSCGGTWLDRILWAKPAAPAPG